MLHSAEVSDALERVRTELEGIDRTLVLLMAERIRTARRAIALRRSRGHETTDLSQEGRVLARAQAWSDEAGVPSDLSVRLFRGLIDEGKRRGIDRGSLPTVTVFLDAPTRAHGVGPTRTVVTRSAVRGGPSRGAPPVA